MSDDNQQDNEISRALRPPTPPFDINDEKALALQEDKDRFLHEWAEFDSLGKACKFSGVTRAQVYRWQLDDPEFAARMKDIHESAVDDVEDKLKDRALGNNETPPGVQVRAAEIYLRAHRADIYSPKHEGENRPVQVQLIIGKKPEPDGIKKTIDVKAHDGTDR